MGTEPAEINLQLPVDDVELDINSAEIYNQAIDKLRAQVWVGLMLISLSILFILRYLRFRNGFTEPTPLGLALMLGFGAVLLGGLAATRTRYATYFQTLYIVAMHVNVPISLLYFGGAQGSGDINLFATIMVSCLYGLRRWMYVSFGISAATLLYVVYLDLVGMPLQPLVENTSQLASVKLVMFFVIVLFSFYLAMQFYRRLLDSYANFSAEQLHLNNTLRANAQQLQQGTQALQLSRQRIVTARAEERRRLRRDLHDGLGPTLAAQVFRVGAARNLYQTQPDKAAGFLREIEESVVGTIDDVKRLVDKLRPALLDRHGLNGAIRAHVQALHVPFSIELDLTEIPADLSAATEVAVWRIVQTALDNVAKHANATCCWLTVAATKSQLKLTIADNGVGMAAGTLEGVGLTSMHERTAELGGTLAVAARHPQGTVVAAQFPIHKAGGRA